MVTGYGGVMGGNKIERGYDGRAKGKPGYHDNVIVTGYGGVMGGNKKREGV